MEEKYQQEFTIATPGYIIIMLDQSGSMSANYTTGYSRAAFAAYCVNNLIETLISLCTSGPELKNKCSIAVYGYGGARKVELVKSGKIIEWNTDKNVVHQKYEIETKNADGFLTLQKRIIRNWIKPISDGLTPMKEAFDTVWRDTQHWIDKDKNHKSFPPIVINITDGEPDEYSANNNFTNTIKSAKRLLNLSTDDGELILMNAFISSDNGIKYVLPASDDEFRLNALAKFLFDISSVLPEPMLRQAGKYGISPVYDNSRGFVFNADAVTLSKLMIFGSTAVISK